MTPDTAAAQAAPAPRALTRKGQQTRQRIIGAAAELIFDHGVAHTTIEDVRAAADVSSSQLYHYFDGKPALVRAVIDHQASTIVGNQEQFDLSSLDGFRAWRDFVVQHQRELNCRGGCPIGSLGSQIAETEPQARAAVAAGFRRWEDTIRAGLRQMHALGRLTPGADPDELALATLAALQGGLLLAQFQRATKPLEASLDAMIKLIAALSTGDAAERTDSHHAPAEGDPTNRVLYAPQRSSPPISSGRPARLRWPKAT
jgi:TetR/AcrR family transcriptional regulator, transcriptional repressor for nem operon